MYALVDCNNFFVSCERLFNPALNGKPVVVLSGNDGCVIARSNEAKALGVGMGQPAFELKELFEREKVAIYSSNHRLYGDISRRIMSFLSQFSPEIEIYSIDEAFLVLDGIDMPSGVEEYMRHIIDEIWRCIGIPVSIGVSATKTLAKIASHRAKKMPRYNGVCCLFTPDQRAIALMESNISNVWGIGRRLSSRLLERGISTAWAFTRMSRQQVRSEYTINGERTWRELQGEVCYEADETPDIQQSIMVSRTFGTPIGIFDDVYNAVANFTEAAARRLRKYGLAAGSIMVFIKGRGCNPDRYVGALELRLPVASDSTIELTQYARKALISIFSSGEMYKKAGVCLGNIVSREHVQLSLFDSVDRDKHRKLMQIMDRVNAKNGLGTLQLGAAYGDKKWHAQSEHLSPNYTTSFKEILVVKADK